LQNTGWAAGAPF